MCFPTDFGVVVFAVGGGGGGMKAIVFGAGYCLPSFPIITAFASLSFSALLLFFAGLDDPLSSSLVADASES